MHDLSTQSRSHRIKKVLWITFGFNLIVAGAKLIYGHYSEMLSMVADGYHSLLDSSSNLIGLMAIYWLAYCQRRQRWEHTWIKIEAFAAMSISVLLFISCWEILHSAYQRFHHPQAPEVTLYSFLIMLGSMAINYGVARYEHRQGEHLSSPILKADSMHSKSDVFASFSVLVALLGVYWHRPSLDWMAAIVISLFVGYSGYKIVLESLQVFLKQEK